MDIVDIKYRLGKQGLTFAQIDRMNGLREGTVRQSLSKPHTVGEQALSKALEIPLKRLFPERYDKNGVRLKPQPSENYNYKKSFI